MYIYPECEVVFLQHVWSPWGDPHPVMAQAVFELTVHSLHVSVNLMLIHEYANSIVFIFSWCVS